MKTKTVPKTKLVALPLPSGKKISDAVSTAVVVASLEKLAAPSIRKVTDLQIKTKDDYELAAILISKLKELSKQAEVEEKRITTPLNEALKATRAHFKPFQNKVSEIENATKMNMYEFLGALKKISAKAEQDFEDGKIKKISTVLNKQADARVDNGTAQVRKVWKLFIDNPDLVPRGYCMPDAEVIKEAMKNGNPVDGCRWEQVDSIAI